MNATNSSEQCGENWQQVGVSCCCTVAQAARSGHCGEINQLIRAGTSFLSAYTLLGYSVHVVSGRERDPLAVSNLSSVDDVYSAVLAIEFCLTVRHSPVLCQNDSS